MKSLTRSFGFWASVSLVVGGIIGSGIFMKPATMAAQLGSPGALLAVWAVAGLITLFGALSNAEIGSMIPETGGQYVFFRKMYGEFFAFLYGWAAFAVFNTAAVASIAYVCSTYAGYFIDFPRFDLATEQAWGLYVPYIGAIFPAEYIGLKAFTIFLVLIFTYVNYRSVEAGGRVMVAFTALKLLAIALVVFLLLFSGQGDTAHFSQSSAVRPQGWSAVLGAWMAAVAGAFWAYDGWNNLTMVSGEIRDPQRNITRSLVVGIPLCILVYMLVNVALLYMMPVDRMASSPMVVSSAMEVLFGVAGGALIAGLIIVSTLGAVQSNIVAVARVTFSMAAAGKFFAWAGRVHPRFGSPGNALWLHGIVACLWVLSGSFDMLTDMLIFVSYFFYGMGALGLFVLRVKMPDAHRPYKVWGYPFVPAVFVVFSFIFLAVTLYHDIRSYALGETPIIQSLLGSLVVLAGVPVYLYMVRRKPAADS